jgi:hypothetical protein
MARLGDVILVDPETELILPAERPGEWRAIRQNSGNALYEIDPSAGVPLSVQTPYLVAGVKGTVFSVIVDAGYSSVSVISGRVDVRCLATEESVELLAGDTVVFDVKRRELEIYHESRGAAMDRGGEVSGKALQSIRKTGRLLDEATTGLMEDGSADDTWAELRKLDLSLWDADRDLRKDDLDGSIEEDRIVLTNEEDSKLIKAGLKRP